jgi:hypothetical protein
MYMLACREWMVLCQLGWIRRQCDETQQRKSVKEMAACSVDVFYFGEDVDIFEPDGTVSHEGAWRAGEPDEDSLAEPGIIMPGTFLLGSRYSQEVADGIALDRAEHVEIGLETTTEAGTFDQCVRVEETTPLEPGKHEKIYCPEI